ncbi:DUF2178 domain-containing protein [Chloroflexota bacterium]
MSAKTYTFFSRVIVVALAAFIASAVIIGMPVFVPIVGVIVALLLRRLCRRFTKEIMVDERLQTAGEKAAAISYRVFSIVMAVLGVGSLTMKEILPPEFSIIGQTLVYSVCALMLLYMAFYYYYEKKL